MKLKHLACLSLLAGAAVGVSAQADTVTFSGSLKQATCVANVNGSGNSNATVVFTGVDVDDFPAAGGGRNKPPVAFTIALSGCAAGSRPYSNFYHGTPATIDSSNSSNLKTLTGTNTNALVVRLHLNDATKSAVYPSPALPVLPSRHSGDPVVTVDSGGAATLTYHAQLFSKGGLVPGPFSTNVSYVIDYD